MNSMHELSVDEIDSVSGGVGECADAMIEGAIGGAVANSFFGSKAASTASPGTPVKQATSYYDYTVPYTGYDYKSYLS